MGFLVWSMNLRLLANQSIPLQLFPFAREYLLPGSALESQLVGARCVTSFNRVDANILDGQADDTVIKDPNIRNVTDFEYVAGSDSLVKKTKSNGAVTTARSEEEVLCSLRP